MPTLSDTFTQGGQTQLHKFHMIRQVFGTTLVVSVTIGILTWGLCVLQELSLNDLIMVLAYWWAKMCVNFGVSESLFKNVSFPFPDGSRSVNCLWVVQNKVISKFVIMAEGILLGKLIHGGVASLITFCGISYYWVFKGRQKRRSKILEGQTIVKPDELLKLIEKEGRTGDFSLAGVPLLKDAELQHFLAVGTTGSGKTNALMELLNQVRSMGHKGIIIDTTGNFVAKYYRPEKDYILNPLDARGEQWNIWADCKLPYEFDAFAECMIPQSGYDPFWTNAAKSIFSSLAQKMNDEPSNCQFVEYAIRAPLHELYRMLRGTDAAALVDPDSEKTALSIRSTLSSNMKVFSYLEDGENNEEIFSIRDWVQGDTQDSWIFLTCKPEQRAALVPLMTAWANLAVNALMSMQPDNNRRLWFVVDEMQTLKKMTELPNHLEELRKYGGCYVMGVQNLSKLDSIYGADLVKSIASLVGTKLIFRSSDAQVAKRLSGFLGEQLLLESGESISFGSHQIRDGVNLTEQKRQKALVSANDIITLNDLEAYLQLPGDWPIAKVKFTYHTVPEIAADFIAKEVKKEVGEDDLVGVKGEVEGSEQVAEVLDEDELDEADIEYGKENYDGDDEEGEDEKLEADAA